MSRQHPLRDAGLAVLLLSVLPTTSKWPEDGVTQVAAWFPTVGVIYSVVGYGLVKFTGALGANRHSSLVVATLVVIAWALLSRMLHWDGLADTADGFWGSHDAQTRLAIMADSHTGAFGATAVTLVALLEVAALSAIISAPHEIPLFFIPVLARFAATAAAWLGTPARPGGLGRSVMGRPTVLAFVVGVGPLACALVGLTLTFDLPGLGFGVLGVLVALATPHVLARRFGGVTGDVMGASVLLTEVVLFTVFALAM